MKNFNDITIQYIKELGKNKSEENFNKLLLYFKENLDIKLKREIISSIGRHLNYDRIFDFLSNEAFNEYPMELVYQMYRTCLYKGKNDIRFLELGNKIKTFYNNENINKMFSYFNYKQQNKKRINNKNIIKKPLLLIGDSEKTLYNLPEQSINMIFTSPPYYNARIYSDYHSYKEYLKKMKNIFIACNRVLEDGRFIIINVSPIITKRTGREFESIRYPIHYDFHKILEESGYYFIDEIIWIKPEPSVPSRISGYLQTHKPLAYKPNCITESIMVYRKNCDFLLDKNINDYNNIFNIHEYENKNIDTSNCWYISPKYNKKHPAVFPEELCEKVLKYYSFIGDTVLDPFAGYGTLGIVAKKMNRIPIMCEINKKYAELINKKDENYYEVRR